MVSQALLGDTVKALETQGDWSRVEGADTYRGWAETRWLAPAGKQPSRRVQTPFADIRMAPAITAPLVLRLPICAGVSRGASLAGDPFDSWVDVLLPGGDALVGWIQEDALAAPPPAATDAAHAVAHAVRGSREFLGTPYLWGGSSAFGLDCSGFVQLCYRLGGLTLRRDADIQRDDPRFAPAPDLQPGDLVFFGTPDKIGHVGMMLTDREFVHAAGGAGVIISPVDDTRYWPSFVDARRLDPARVADPVTRFEAEDR